MDMHFNMTRIWALCIALSLVAHILFLGPLKLIGDYHFVAPVKPIQAIMVDLQRPVKEALALPSASVRSEYMLPLAPSEQPEADREPAVSAENRKKRDDVSSTGDSKVTSGSVTTASQQEKPLIAVTPPMRTAGEFLATENEKLSYQISLLGMPVGSAELEAKNEKGEVRITLRTKSNAALADIYPIDDIVETRHIGGNFILTKFRQQEGTLKRNLGFTIFLRDKRVFWIDLLRMRSTEELVPTSEVLDTLSAFYYLRNRQLHIGKTEMLHIYDGEGYSDVPVEVLRRENVRLPNLRNVDTLVLQPVQQDGGIFKRTRDILIWLTNDENRVPVKVETSIPIGRVTAILVSSEARTSQDLVSTPPEIF